MPGKLDFEEQFCFYAAYHTNLINVLIHIPCVPTILFTALVLIHHFSWASYSLLDIALGGGHVLNLTFPVLVVAGYATYFVLLEPLAGILYAPLLLALGHFSNVLYSTEPHAVQYAGYVFVAAWIAQFVGHGKFEGRAPALLDSLLQSLVLAVFFVFLEILFYLGYKPELHRRLQNRTGVAVAEYRREKAAKQRAKKVQ
ncbi:DUF962 domain protein [Leucosporidium creatinivorum]|uniref:DUF962 domain protein n=1 Tax=Leucosporidium creatinivorum TaxID=106004 RepID=A0A1Y2FZH6_9BASI|nr:DUF962 domain protein [Leucosporidium creatinivorum]